MNHSLSQAAIPLFPLGTVLFPDGILPLRIFEVRYLDMIKKCHRAGTPFGVVSLTAGHEVQNAAQQGREMFSAVGTLARITDFMQPHPGLYEVVTRGESRFRVTGSVQLPHGLWMADIEPLPADAPCAIPVELTYLPQHLVRMLDMLSAADIVQVPAPRRLDDAGWVANRWCELLPLSTVERQRMMELADPLLRLELVGDLLDKTELGASGR